MVIYTYKNRKMIPMHVFVLIFSFVFSFVSTQEVLAFDVQELNKLLQSNTNNLQEIRENLQESKENIEAVIEGDTIRSRQIIPKHNTGYLSNLPSGDIATFFLPRFITIAMTLTYTVSTGFMLYAGFLYVNSSFASDETGKAKDIMKNAVIAIIIATLSYAIVQGVITLNFFA